MTLAVTWSLEKGMGGSGAPGFEGVGGEEDPWLFLLTGALLPLILRPCHIASGATLLRGRGSGRWSPPGPVILHCTSGLNSGTYAVVQLRFLSTLCLQEGALAEDERVSAAKCFELP